MPAPTSNAPRLVRRTGLALLLIGWIAAACVFFTAPADPRADTVAQQREMRELERLGGTATAQTVRFDQWLGSLWHGRRLAATLAVLSLVVAAGCTYVAGLMAEDVGD
jgi:hypothetical protein